MLDVTFPIAFVAGIISFFAPCVIPLIPGYIGYILGSNQKSKKQIFLTAILYVLGFSIIFVLLGSISGGIGLFLRRNLNLFRKIGGFLIIIFGMQFAGILKVPFLNYEKKFNLPKNLNKLGLLRPFVLGIVFAFAWSPCIGPVLGSILALAASTQTATSGAILLFFFSLGISIPFVIISMSLSYAPKYIGFFKKNIKIISQVSGILLAILGSLLLFDLYKYVNAWVFGILY